MEHFIRLSLWKKQGPESQEWTGKFCCDSIALSDGCYKNGVVSSFSADISGFRAQGDLYLLIELQNHFLPSITGRVGQISLL